MKILTRKTAMVFLISLVAALAVACAAAPASQPNPEPNGNSTPVVSGPTPEPEVEMVEVEAPIESVDIEVQWPTADQTITEVKPVEYIAKIVSGLPSGCAEFNDYEVTRDGNTINIRVTNLEPAPGQQVACTAIYGYKETSVSLGSEFVDGESYTVDVNGTTETFVAGPESSEETVTEPAPVESVSIVIDTETNQGELVVISGLPDSCYEFGDYNITREGDTITVEVNNVRPADTDIACADIYRTVETRIAIPGEVEACKVYEVVVNGERKSAQAIAPNVTCPAAEETVTEPAPIDSVSVVVDADTGEGEVVVISGLPNNCYEFGDYSIERMDNVTFEVEVNNVRPADLDRPCGEIYGIVENRIAITGEVEVCKVYNIVVNGQRYSAQAISPVVKCANPTPQGNPDPEMQEVLAPIESVEIAMTKSLPPQYIVMIKSGLPSGCAKFNDYEVTQDGTTINIKVTNLEPVPAADVFCTAIYGIHDGSVNIGSDFEAGVTYTVVVNDEVTETFVGHGNGTVATAGSKHDVGFGEVVVIESEGLEIEFVDVLDDSRCPANVVCVWAGQARILVNVRLNGEDLGQRELLLEPGAVQPKPVVVGGYRISLVALNPYPVTEVNIEKSEYVAGITISKADAEDDTEVKVNLSAEPVEGQPMAYRFVAEIVGGPDNNPYLYCTGTGWDFGDGNRAEMIPTCLEWTPDIEINRHFEETHTYEAPGTYTVEFHHGPVSQTIEVEVS